MTEMKPSNLVFILSDEVPTGQLSVFILWQALDALHMSELWTEGACGTPAILSVLEPIKHHVELQNWLIPSSTFPFC